LRTLTSRYKINQKIVVSPITDSFVFLKGPMVVETRAPRNTYEPRRALRCAADDGPPRSWS
jgi:hypothetical protein